MQECRILKCTRAAPPFGRCDGCINCGAAYFGGGTVLCCTAMQPGPSSESGAGGTGGGINVWVIFVLLISGAGPSWATPYDGLNWVLRP